MNKLLFLELWMALCIAKVGGIICYSCIHYLDNVNCRTARKMCVIKNGFCARRTLFIGDTNFYTWMGCLPTCKNIANGVDIYEVQNCCNDRNFCNI